MITSGEGGLNKISFNSQEPIIVIGVSTGRIHSLKLSPNLRKKTKEIIRAMQNNNPREIRWEIINIIIINNQSDTTLQSTIITI